MADTAVDYENQNALDQARNRNTRQQRKESGVENMGKKISPRAVLSSVKHMDFLRDIPFFAAFGAALLKDFLDFAVIGSFPAIGTVITLCVSAFVGAMLFIAGSSGKEKAIAKRWIRRFGVLGFGTVFEIIFGVNFLPVETTMVFLLYTMTLKERAQSQK